MQQAASAVAANPIPQSVMYQQLPDGQIQVYKLPTGVVPVLVSTSGAPPAAAPPPPSPTEEPHSAPSKQLTPDSRRNSQDDFDAAQETVQAVSNGQPVQFIQISI